MHDSTSSDSNQADSHRDHIEAAFELDEQPEKISGYYKNWADSYDTDVLVEGYPAPATVAQMAIDYAKQIGHPINSETRILDAGCGTGLVGVEIKKRINNQCMLNGFDLSVEMVEKAEETQCYDQLWSNIDLNENLHDQLGNSGFNITLCCGVFTLGHVPPPALLNLLNVTKTSGLVVISARKEYCDETNFSAYCEDVASSLKAKILFMEFGPYVSDDFALYAVFQKC